MTGFMGVKNVQMLSERLSQFVSLCFHQQSALTPCWNCYAEQSFVYFRYNKRDREASGLERRVQVLERQLADLQGRELEKENQVSFQY